MYKTKKSKFMLSLLTAAAIAVSSMPLSTAFAVETQEKLVGDFNNDGQIDVADLLMLKSCVLGRKTTIKITEGDINGDGVISALDYLLLKKKTLTYVSADTKVVKANTDFAFDIFKTLNKTDAQNNVFISPFSISTALSMAYEGAGSSTKEEMESALKYKGLDINTINQGYKKLLEYLNNIDPKVKLNINNSIWYKNGLKVNDNFLNTNKNVFNSYISQLDFADPEAAATINSWISDATNRKIPSMITSTRTEDIMYLINAIYFKGEWTNVFDENSSDFGSFCNGKNEHKEVVYMQKKHEAIDYGKGNDYTAVRLPYGNGSTAMYCILPDKDIPVNDFIASLNTQKWNTIKQSIKKTENVKLMLPRFKMEYGSLSLKDSLKSLGINTAFTEKADFKGISHDLFISDVKHKAVVEVNEKGTEAVAVTVIGGATSCAPESTPEFIADRPFVFAIADEKNGSILFLGKAFDLEETVNIDENTNGKQVILRKGQKLKLLLTQSTTPYIWQRKDSVTNKNILSLSKEYSEANVPGVPIDNVGVSAHYWEYKAVGSGDTTIRLEYLLPGKAPAKVYQVDINVIE